MATKSSTSSGTRFEHKGVEITIDHGGMFVAYVDNVRHRKPSLDTIKAAIDEAKRAPFQPFSILIEGEDRRGQLTLTELRIVGHDKGDRRNRFDGPAFIDEKGARHKYAQPIATSENAEAIRALRLAQEQHRKVEAEWAEREHKLKAKIVYVKPGDYQQVKS